MKLSKMGAALLAAAAAMAGAAAIEAAPPAFATTEPASAADLESLLASNPAHTPADVSWVSVFSANWR